MRCFGPETDPPIRIATSVLKRPPLCVCQDQRTAPKAPIDVSPTSTQSIQNGGGVALVRDVETSLTPLKTGSQKGQGRRKLLFLRVVDNAKMFVQAKSACQLGQT